MAISLVIIRKDPLAGDTWAPSAPPPSTLRVGLAKNDTTSQPPYYFTTYFPHWLAYALHHRLREQP